VGVNNVALIGTLVEDPKLRENGTDPVRCTIRLAVPRRDHTGLRLPGVVYVDAAIFGLQARGCAERLRRGHQLGLAGRLEQDKYKAADGGWRIEHLVLADQLEFLTS
jgi:single-stranded DNA-binding protein